MRAGTGNGELERGAGVEQCGRGRLDPSFVGVRRQSGSVCVKGGQEPGNEGVYRVCVASLTVSGIRKCEGIRPRGWWAREGVEGVGAGGRARATPLPRRPS